MAAMVMLDYFKHAANPMPRLYKREKEIKHEMERRNKRTKAQAHGNTSKEICLVSSAGIMRNMDMARAVSDKLSKPQSFLSRGGCEERETVNCRIVQKVIDNTRKMINIKEATTARKP